jgi:Rps23 Pro-64 3,4-dihydroxylase Tpa1-like proline 4-hydroxylase
MNYIMSINNIINSNVINNPFPHIEFDNFLNVDFAKKIQNDILNIDDKMFDSFNNPFEKNKNFSHKEKKNLPQSIKELFLYLNSSSWLELLGNKFNIENLEGDNDLYLWGVHTYKNGGKLEPHLDSKICPITKREKVITLCLYLSKDWDKNYGGNLQLWNSNNYKISSVEKQVQSLFNNAIIFLANEKSYHGVNKIIDDIHEKSIRILISASFYKRISDKRMDEIKSNKRPYGLYKALFSTLEKNKQIEEFIKKRANVKTCNEIINMNC